MEYVSFAKKVQIKENKWVFLHQMPLKILVLLMSQFLDLCSGIKEFKSMLIMITNETIGVKIPAVPALPCKLVYSRVLLGENNIGSLESTEFFA